MKLYSGFSRQYFLLANGYSGNHKLFVRKFSLRNFFGKITGIFRIHHQSNRGTKFNFFFPKQQQNEKLFFFFLISQWIHHHLDHFVVVVSNWTLLFCSLDDAIWNPRSRKKSAYMKKKEKKYRLLSDTMDSYSLGCCCFSALPEFILQNILPGFLMLLLLRKLFLIYKSLRSEERI